MRNMLNWCHRDCLSKSVSSPWGVSPHYRNSLMHVYSPSCTICNSADKLLQKSEADHPLHIWGIHSTDGSSCLQTNVYRLGLITHLQAEAVPLKTVQCLRDLQRMYEAATVEDVMQAYHQIPVDDQHIFTCIGTSGPNPLPEVDGFKVNSARSHPLRRIMLSRVYFHYIRPDFAKTGRPRLTVVFPMSATSNSPCIL